MQGILAFVLSKNIPKENLYLKELFFSEWNYCSIILFSLLSLIISNMIWLGSTLFKVVSDIFNPISMKKNLAVPNMLTWLMLCTGWWECVDIFLSRFVFLNIYRLDICMSWFVQEKSLCNHSETVISPYWSSLKFCFSHRSLLGDNILHGAVTMHWSRDNSCINETTHVSL